MMDRRTFLVIASATAAGLHPQTVAAQQPLPHARWLENGLIDAGGSHEPYLFVVRRGGQRLDARESYERAQSETVIRALKESGVEVFHTHLYKGFGMAAEMPEMEDAVKTAAIAHRYGLKVDSYIQWNTMMYETFFAEEPRAKDWVQRDSLGRPILLTYGYQQSYRYRPCFNNREYLDYLKKIVRFAVEEVKTDFIHFDNFDLNAEPDSCRCPQCLRRFRDFLKEKYTPEQRKERFGFSNVDHVNPPEWNAPNPPNRMEIIFDPAIQEWIDFRCQFMADALRQVASYAKSLNAEVAIEINPHGITGGNRAWEAGLDHARLLRSTQVFWTEEPNMPGHLADGRLISKIRSFKLARAFDNILLTYITGDELAIAECLAFNQTIGYAGNYPLNPVMRSYIDFYRKHRDLFTGTRDASDVAVLRSYPSITYNHARCQLSAILAEQALIQARIPFRLIFDADLADLSAYRVVILPESECLSDAQVAAIRKFVENGGGLVVIGRAGLYDRWRRVRVKPGLAGLVDRQPPARDYEERVVRQEARGEPMRKQAGRGRVFYLPALRFDGKLPEFGGYFHVDSRFWKRPANWKEFADGVEWAANSAPLLHVEGPEFLVANTVEQRARRKAAIHLVNYNARGGPLQNVAVSFRLPQGVSPATVRMIGPDLAEGRELKFENRGGAIAFAVPQVNAYAIAVVEWR